MPTCPTCFHRYADDVVTCAHDGASLVPDEVYASVDRDLPPGAVVGEYQVEAKIGEGGFGTVYRAVHPLIGKSAAIKVLSRECSANPAMVSRFVEEARAVNKIGHKNIIDVFAFGQLPDGRQYYVMEHLRGMPLDKYIASRGRLSLGETIGILRGVARALDATHAKGILHRDLKPENIFLVIDEDGSTEAKLLDFGLAKLSSGGASHRTKTGTPMGTPYYMSPEQCRGVDVDRRTDVYSFGAMVFEMLTGEVPFTGDSAMDVLVKHMSQSPPSALTRAPELPPAIDEALGAMLAKEPDRRPGSIGAALDLLVHLTGDVVASRAVVPTSFAPPSAARSEPLRAVENAQTFLASENDVVTPPRRGRPWIAAAAAAVLALGAGVAIVVMSRGRTAKAHEDPVPVVSVASPARAATPSAVPSAAPSAAPSAPPAVRTFAVRLTDTPPGALVAVDGKNVGAASSPVTLTEGSEARLVVSAPGFLPREIRVTPTSDVSLSAPLQKASHPKKGAIHSDLENFEK